MRGRISAPRRLTAYRLNVKGAGDLRAAPMKRDWMPPIAYHCLPLKIANQFGWQILCDKSFSAVWDGTDDRLGVTVYPHDEYLDRLLLGYGLLTFPLKLVFRTSRNVDLFVTGPLNQPKDGIACLSAVVETDWLPFEFFLTMKFTRAQHIVDFEKGEPLCQIFPIPRGYLDNIEPKSRHINDNPKLAKQWQEWNEQRAAHRERNQSDGTMNYLKTSPQFYTRGVLANEELATKTHHTRLRLKEFEMEAAAKIVTASS